MLPYILIWWEAPVDDRIQVLQSGHLALTSQLQVWELLTMPRQKTWDEGLKKKCTLESFNDNSLENKIEVYFTNGMKHGMRWCFNILAYTVVLPLPGFKV